MSRVKSFNKAKIMGPNLKILLFVGLMISVPFGASIGYAVAQKLKGNDVDYLIWWQNQWLGALAAGVISAVIGVYLVSWIKISLQKL